MEKNISVENEISNYSNLELNDSKITKYSNPTLTRQEVKIPIKMTIKGYSFFKRSFDILFSFLSIVILSPIFIIAMIIMICSFTYSVIFKDKRIGKNGKSFNVYKFRTMYDDAEKNIEKYLNKEQIKMWNDERKLINDPRVSKIGKILRKTSIDELPQLFNILIGNMSFIGNRPITERELNENYYQSEKDILLTSKPGLSGYWQVYGRENANYKNGKRQELELEYYKHRSLSFDLLLIFKTIPAVFQHHETDCKKIKH
ncbi:MAG: sugar transferase [Bacilli bacterium]